MTSATKRRLYLMAGLALVIAYALLTCAARTEGRDSDVYVVLGVTCLVTAFCGALVASFRAHD